MKSLFLAWQAPANASATHSRAWFPVGQLDAETRPGAEHYRFRYTKGALDAEKKIGFAPLPAFPKFRKDYQSSELFPLFTNRVLSPKRGDFQEYIQWLDLDKKNADPIAILAVSGGRRETDNLEVFPKVEADASGKFHIRFFLHGLRHLGAQAQERAASLRHGEALKLFVELNNPATRLAVPLMTDDYQMIGWAPRYLVEDLIKCIPKAPELSARVVKINPASAPMNQRVLIEYSGQTPKDFRPMSSPDFTPLLG